VFLGPELTAALTLNAPDPEVFDRFGSAVASGDVTGDGVGDVVVGAPGADVDEALDSAGKIFIFSGPELEQIISLSSPKPQVSAGMGGAIAVGDVNGDGMDDVIAGSSGAEVSGIENAGQVAVFFGG
jgi:hypothetical protein